MWMLAVGGTVGLAASSLPPVARLIDRLDRRGTLYELQYRPARALCDEPQAERPTARAEKQSIGFRRVPNRLSSPMVRPGGRLTSARGRAGRPGRRPRARSASWRIVSSWPGSARSTSWCATMPGSRTEWIGTSPPIALRGRLRGSRRRVDLGLVVQLDDLGARDVLRRLGREAHHQDGSDREVRREEDAADRARARVARPRPSSQPGRPDDARARRARARLGCSGRPRPAR